MKQYGDYTWRGIKGGIGGTARVRLELLAAESSGVEEAYVPQEYPSLPYECWRRSAINGIRYGLARTGGRWTVRLTDISGHLLHTSAAMVAYAALRAFWEAAAVVPEAAELERLEAFVYATWLQRDPLVADLETRTLS